MIRRVVLALYGLATLVALALVLGQHSFPAAVFEWGQHREFEGLLEEAPYPALLVPRPNGFSRYLLVAAGKHGAYKDVLGFHGSSVSLRGSLIARDGQHMIEIVPDTIATTARIPMPTLRTVDLGSVKLRGEIVDSKCWMGVMNPGEGKVHRDCAVRCISGGIPPALRAGGKLYLLAGVNPRDILHMVAEPVTVAGRLTRSGDTLILMAERLER